MGVDDNQLRLQDRLNHAVGSWNFAEVSPQNVLGNFNGFLKSVILRISEARDLGEVDRFKFYDHSKALTAAPPDVLRVNEKNLREHYVPNITGVIITTNHKTDGIFLPADDRRHFVAWSELDREDFPEAYWNALWRWYLSGGLGHVAAYLRTLDLSLFDPKAPPPKTEAFWAIVDAHHAPKDAELADVLDSLARKMPGSDEQEWPDAVTVLDIANAATAAGGGFLTWITDRKNRRAIPHRMEQAGYVPVRNPGRKDGKWIINGSRQVAYGRGIGLRAGACPTRASRTRASAAIWERRVRPFPAILGDDDAQIQTGADIHCYSGPRLPARV